MLNEAIKEAGGDHSAIIEVQEDKAPLFNPALLTFPRILAEDNIVTLILPSFPASDEENVHTYVTTALEQLSKISDPKGVIIDLRGNTGGNMMPMLGHALLSLKKVNYSNLLLLTKNPRLQERRENMF